MAKEYFVKTGLVPAAVDAILDSDSFLQSLPRIDEISPVMGGVAHQVFQIRSGDKRYYLKIRGDRFASVPEITCNPDDIESEYRALTAFHQVSPDNFPQVLAFDKNRHYVILSDAMPNGEKLEDLFVEGKVTPTILFNIGSTLKKIHAASSSYRDTIRDGGDQIYYHTVLGHRFGYRHHPVLDSLVQSLSALHNKHLILGDASPKNIGVNNNGELFIFFDLETAHQGDVVFDYAYFLGHILVHSLTSPPEIALADAESYVQGYGQHDFDDLMVKQIALGTMLYRLRSIIPYPTGLDAEQTTIMEQKVESMLPHNLAQSSWAEIIAFIHHGQN